MLNQRLFWSIWLLDTIQQLKVPVWCNRSSGGSVTVLGGYTNVANGINRKNIFALVLQDQWNPSGQWAISKCSASVDSHLFSCSGRPWRSHPVNSSQHPAHEGKGQYRGKIFISSMLPREVTAQVKQGLWLILHRWRAREESGPSSRNNGASTPTNPDWLERGPQDAGTRQKNSTTSFLLWMSFWFPPIVAPPLGHSLLPYCPQTNVSILSFKCWLTKTTSLKTARHHPNSNKNVPLEALLMALVLQWLHSVPTHLQKDLSYTV